MPITARSFLSTNTPVSVSINCLLCFQIWGRAEDPAVAILLDHAFKDLRIKLKAKGLWDDEQFLKNLFRTNSENGPDSTYFAAVRKVYDLTGLIRPLPNW